MIQILIAWLLADFITGVVHWYEEKYMQGPYKWEWVQEMFEDNRLHHTKPTAMCQYSWWENVKFPVFIATPIAVCLYLTGLPTLLWLAVFFAGFGNLIHRWSHDPVSEVPLWAQVLQSTGLFISREHHDTHHRHDGKLIKKEVSRRAYCPMSNWLNPVLDYIGFWGVLETIMTMLGQEKASAEV